MIVQEELVEYFEELASLHLDIAHDNAVFEKRAFLYGDVEMLVEDIGGFNSANFVMLLEAGSGSLNGPDEVNLYDNTDVAFMICHPVQEGDRAQQRTIEQRCKEIGLQIIKRIQKDREMQVKDWLMDFELNNIRYQRVYGIPNNRFGFRFEFNISDSAQLEYDPNVWTDETP